MLDACRCMVQCALMIAFVLYDNLSIERAIWAMALCFVLGCLLRLSWLLPTHHGLKGLRGLLQQQWVFGRWLLGSAVLQWVTGNLFMLVSGATIGTSAVGALRAAQNITQPIHVLLLALDNRIPVTAARTLAQSGAEGLAAYVRQVWLRVGVIIIGLALLFSLGAGLLIQLAYGDAFRPYAYLVAFYAANGVLRFVGTPIVAALRAFRDTQSIFTANISMGLCTLATVYPLLKYGALTGAAAGITLSYTVWAIHLGIGYKRRIEEPQAG
jgi:O-antigen/teichoic acid export membrane protein